MCFRWIVLCLAGLCCVQSVRADTIVLRDGTHVEGQIVGETTTDVSVRRAFKNSNIQYVDKIARANIARIERSTTRPAEAAAAPTSRPAPAEPAVSGAKIVDKPAFLEEAIKKFVKPDYHASGVDLTRLIAGSTPGEREQLSQIVQDKLGASLAELAALAHFQDALERARGRAVQIQYVTDYEKPALAPLLKEAYEKAIDAEISVRGGDDDRDDHPEGRAAPQARGADNGRSTNGPAAGADARRERRTRDTRRRTRSTARSSRRGERENEAEGKGDKEDGEDGEDEKGEREDDDQPTSRPSMTIRAWMDNPADFNGNRRESLAMSVQIYHAKSLLAERARLDPQAKTDLDLKAELAVDRGKLDALLRAVKGRAGGALTPQEREAQEAEYRNRIDAAQRSEMRRRQQAWGDLMRLMEEQERQRQYSPGPDRAVPPPKE